MRRLFIYFFFNDTATTEIYTLSLHDALPISPYLQHWQLPNLFILGGSTFPQNASANPTPTILAFVDRKSTRLNSSHSQISYAVFCLKKKKRLSNFDNGEHGL